MLARTAANLFWIGRYMERAEFTTRLIEATIRLDSLSPHTESSNTWASALTVVGAGPMSDSGEALTSTQARAFLSLEADNPNSVKSCVGRARDNARAARNRLTQEVWEAINRTWLTLGNRKNPGGIQGTVNLVEEIKAETRGFEGALQHMLRTEANWFMRLGTMIERMDNTARLLDVKYYLLLPQGQEVGGALDRDQWMTLLHVVSGQGAYRLIYKQALQPWLVADLLIYRRELPRSLASCAARTVALLGRIGAVSGRQGEADRLARRRLDQFEASDVATLIRRGLHESLQKFITENGEIDGAIARQFKFA
jgi:uncharacterized alpha-E superfamily protein